MNKKKKSIEVEKLFHDDEESFYWRMCSIEGCNNGRCLRLDSEYCYPHSAWYRPLLVPFNKMISRIRIFLEKLTGSEEA